MIIRLAQESLKQANLKEIPDVESYSAVEVRCGRRSSSCALWEPPHGPMNWPRIWDRSGLTSPFSPRLAVNAS